MLCLWGRIRDCDRIRILRGYDRWDDPHGVHRWQQRRVMNLCVLYRFPGSVHCAGYLVLRKSVIRPAELTAEELVDFHGTVVEAGNWAASHVATLGRSLGELWLFQRTVAA